MSMGSGVIPFNGLILWTGKQNGSVSYHLGGWVEVLGEL
jgi:hypothetical protein